MFRFIVEGDSMTPTYQRGDRLLIDPLFWRIIGLHINDIIVLRDPRDSRLILKRIKDILPTGKFFVDGDNEAHSTDSRHFGPILKKQIVGRVWRKY
ncbi:MAG TPA: S26 family signal peptidase [Patescibacteria group bacterium]|nr:S26 family signal peptidase [Patescibacteria group bacterium]